MTTICTKIAAGITALSLSACSTMTHIPLEPTPRLAIAIGDNLEIVTINGNKLSFKVESIDQLTVSGQGMQARFDEIARIERREISGSKTVVAAAATVAGIYVLLYLFGIVALLALVGG